MTCKAKNEQCVGEACEHYARHCKETGSYLFVNPDNLYATAARELISAVRVQCQKSEAGIYKLTGKKLTELPGFQENVPLLRGYHEGQQHLCGKCEKRTLDRVHDLLRVWFMPAFDNFYTEFRQMHCDKCSALTSYPWGTVIRGMPPRSFLADDDVGWMKYREVLGIATPPRYHRLPDDRQDIWWFAMRT